MRLRTAFDPLCTGRWMCSQTAGVAAIASIDAGREIGGIGAGEPDPPHPVNAADRAEQVGEVVLAVVVAVDRLPQQGDLGGALLHQPGYFPHHIRQPPAPLGTAGLRDDAEGATVIAPALYRDECGGALFPHRRDILVVLPGAKLGVADPLAAVGQADELGKVAVTVGTDHQIHSRHLSSSAGPNRCAMQPTTPRTLPARLCRWSSPTRPITRCSALSRTAQVLTSMTSASPGCRRAHTRRGPAPRASARSRPRSSGSRRSRCRRFSP